MKHYVSISALLINGVTDSNEYKTILNSVHTDVVVVVVNPGVSAEYVESNSCSICAVRTHYTGCIID